MKVKFLHNSALIVHICNDLYSHYPLPLRGWLSILRFGSSLLITGTFSLKCHQLDFCDFVMMSIVKRATQIKIYLDRIEKRPEAKCNVVSVHVKPKACLIVIASNKTFYYLDVFLH